MQSEQDIADFIARNRPKFGFSLAVEKQSANFYTRNRSAGPSDTLRAADASNISSMRTKFAAASAHIEASKANFRKTSLSAYSSGEDLAFVMAIGTRESGDELFSTSSQEVVSGGKDTHAKGHGGLDNLWNRRQEFQRAGLSVRQVDQDDPDFRAPTRAPAWIKKKDLLFSYMVSTAYDEKQFRTRHIELYAKTAGVQIDQSTVQQDLETLWGKLTPEARRAWLALYYSGPGIVGDTLVQLFQHQQAQGKTALGDFDLNAILTDDTFTPDIMERVGLARATSLRASVFERLK